MDPSELEHFRKLLQEERERLLKAISVHTEELKKMTADETGDKVYSDHMADMALLSRMKERKAGVLQKEWRELKEIEDALTRIKQGIYGICQRCGKPIERERLEIIPYTRFCSTCGRTAGG